MMLDLKEKIGYLKKKIQVWYCTTVWCYFLKIFVKRVKHFLVEQLLECSGPAAAGPRAAGPRAGPRLFFLKTGFPCPRRVQNILEGTPPCGKVVKTTYPDYLV